MVFAVQDLHIEFGPRVLFDSLSFVVERGERIAFAGHNGAGKSTLMKGSRMITGLSDRAAGSL